MGEHNSDKPQACIRDAGTKGGGRSAMSHFCRTSAGDHGKETSRHGDGEDRRNPIAMRRVVGLHCPNRGLAGSSALPMRFWNSYCRNVLGG
jgi:hypothetical protein